MSLPDRRKRQISTSHSRRSRDAFDGSETNFSEETNEIEEDDDFEILPREESTLFDNDEGEDDIEDVKPSRPRHLDEHSLFQRMTRAGQRGLNRSSVMEEEAGLGAANASDLIQMPTGFLFHLLSRLSDGVIGVRADSKIILFDKGSERIFGYTRDEMEGEHIKGLVPKIYRRHHSAWVREFIESNEWIKDMGGSGSSDRQVSGVHADGRDLYFNAWLCKLERGGKKRAFVIIRLNSDTGPTAKIRHVRPEDEEDRHRKGNGNGEKPDNTVLIFINHAMSPFIRLVELTARHFKAVIVTVFLSLFATILTSPAWLSEEKWDRIVALWDDGDQIVQPKVLDSLKPPQRAKTTCKLPNGQAILVDEDTCRTLTRSVEKPAPYEDLVPYRNKIGQVVMVPREAAERLEILNQGVIQDYRSMRQSRAPSVARDAPPEESFEDLLKREEALMEEIRRRLPAEAPQE